MTSFSSLFVSSKSEFSVDEFYVYKAEIILEFLIVIEIEKLIIHDDFK